VNHGQPQQDPQASGQGGFTGAGGAIDPLRARDISIVESLERYSSCTWNDADIVMATEAELGAAAVGPDAAARRPPSSLRVDATVAVTI